MSSPHDAKSPKENEESVEAHLLRELLWVSTITANAWPASQAQKSKSRCATAYPGARY